jgi:ubiquinone/menaquinone biosynthesis C-methylase UbiE
MAEKTDAIVSGHYGLGDLADRILGALEQSGIDAEALTPVDIAPVDEFHMGGRAATAHVIGQLDLPTGAKVLDVGSGLGGVARYLADECGCHATGIDLTPEYVDVAKMLTERTGLTNKVEFVVGSALDLPWPENSFDAAVTFHVAMNIADRPGLYGNVARVLRSRGSFAVYDVMKGPEQGMLYPLPWAETSDTSFLVTPEEMRTLLDEAGFDVVVEEDRREVALEHHRSRLAQIEEAGGPPPLGLHILQGETAGIKSRNMIEMLESNQITLGAIIARRKA